MGDINFLTPQNSNFYKSKSGFLALRSEQNEYARVSLFKAFPFSHSNNYISVRDKDGKEIGLIKDINDFSMDVIDIFNEELTRRYLLPSIKSISSIKDEFGYSYWEVITGIGAKKFTIRKDNNSFIPISEHRILVVDVDGNRYEISDYTKLDSKSYKLIELLL
jgi:hypothetical protein